MSKTTIYRCDLCGDESTKARDWELGADVGARWGNHSGAQITFKTHLDICPKCAELIESEFSAAWKKVSGK